MKSSDCVTVESCSACSDPCGSSALDEFFEGEWVDSLCPVCFKKIPAYKHWKQGDVYMEKACSEHGYFETLIWKDADHYREFGKDATHARKNPGLKPQGSFCPQSCGLCAEHEGDSCIAVIELTTRCDLHCPVCFAAAGDGAGYDVPFEDVMAMIDAVLQKDVVPTVQLSGGEPTLHPDLLDIVFVAKARGIRHLMLNTNGKRLAAEPGFAHALKAAELDAVYLQFDSVDDERVKKLRGGAYVETKKRAIENCRAAGLGVILVPTLVAGVNGDEVGRIIDFATENMPTVKGVHFQPATHFGRFDAADEDHDGPLTLSDVIFQIEQHIGEDTHGAIMPRQKFDAHCSFSATFLRGRRGVLHPVAVPEGRRRIDPSEVAFDIFAKETADFTDARWRNEAKSPSAGLNSQLEGAGDTAIPADTTFSQFLLDRTLTLSGMHFQDVENIDLQRTRGCCVHVIDAKGNSIPLCVHYLTNRDGVRWRDRAC